MFKVKIMAHHLKEIDSEPIPFATYSHDDIGYVMARCLQDVSNFSNKHGFKVFSLRIDITEDDK